MQITASVKVIIAHQTLCWIFCIGIYTLLRKVGAFTPVLRLGGYIASDLRGNRST